MVVANALCLFYFLKRCQYPRLQDVEELYQKFNRLTKYHSHFIPCSDRPLKRGRLLNNSLNCYRYISLVSQQDGL